MLKFRYNVILRVRPLIVIQFGLLRLLGTLKKCNATIE
jgi:hypothetical protein